MYTRKQLRIAAALYCVLSTFTTLPASAATTFVCKFSAGAQEPLYIRIDKETKKISWSNASNPKATRSCALRQFPNAAVGSCQTRFIPKNYSDEMELSFFEQMDRLTLREKESKGAPFDKTGHMEIHTIGINRYSLSFYHDSHLRLHARRKGQKEWLDLSGLKPRLSVTPKNILVGKPRGQCRPLKGEIQAKF